MGADFVKIYATAFPTETFAALMDEARQDGLAVTGHLPFTTHTVRECIEAGIHDIQHVEVFVLAGCTRNEQQIVQQYTSSRPAMSIAELLSRYAAAFDPDWARDLISRLKQHDVWVTPTLAVVAQANTAGRVDHSYDPNRRYILPGIWKSWEPNQEGNRKPPSDTDLARWETVHERSAELIRMLQAGGVGLLAGSDCGAFNNYTFPGWMLHTELIALVKGGLTPMQALQTATRNPALYLGELDRSGTVETGKVANLVLLRANPLDDIANVRQIDSVVIQGKLLTHSDLDRLLGVISDLNR
jgi:hypothetical protein